MVLNTIIFIQIIVLCCCEKASRRFGSREICKSLEKLPEKIAWTLSKKEKELKRFLRKQNKKENKIKKNGHYDANNQYLQ